MWDTSKMFLKIFTNCIATLSFDNIVHAVLSKLKS